MMKAERAMPFDNSTLLLLLSNIVTIIVAIYERWRWAEVIWIYWGQSMVLCLFHMRRINALRHALGTSVAERRSELCFYVVFYGFAHLIYACFLVGSSGDLTRQDLYGILACVALFTFNHYFSFTSKRGKDRSCQPCRRSVDRLFLVPGARILPMHLTLIVGLTSSGRSVGMLIGFLSLKTLLDVITHVVENRAPRQTSDGAAEEPLARMPARIRDRSDVEAFVLATTRDKELTRFLMDVIEQVGRDGYIAVERGGNGNPYEAEYQAEPEVPDPRKPSEIQAECERLRQALPSADSNSERDRIERSIAQLVGGICTIRINVTSYDRYSRQKALIIDTWARFREMVSKVK